MKNSLNIRSKGRKNQMKNKKILSLIAGLASVTLLASCTNVSNRVTFSENWNTDPTHSTPSVTETLKYKVSFEKLSGLDAVNYDLDYSNGTYTAKLTPLPDKSGYEYKTTLTIDVTYSLGESTKTETDTMTSTVVFKSSGSSLQPISSVKEMLCHSPLNAESASKIEDCYSKYEYTIATNYEPDLSKGKTVITNLAATENNVITKEFEIEDEKNTYLDNEQLLFALRGVSPSLNSAPAFLVYAPFTSAVQTIKSSFSATTSKTSFSFNRNEVPVTKEISYREVSVSIDSKTPGATQTVWIAEKGSDPQNNENRNIILKMSTPISYNFGTLVYELSEETFSL